MASSRMIYIFVQGLVIIVLIVFLATHLRPGLLQMVDNDTGKYQESKEMNRKPPVIMCGILTRTVNFESKTKAVSNTWAKRCDQPHFFYTKNKGSHYNLERGVPPSIPDDRKTLVNKSYALFRWSYDKYKEIVDWFMKCDDDTYVIMENLRLAVFDLDSRKAYYIGQRLLNANRDYYYHSGGAGYLLSREAARRLATLGASNPQCPKNGAEDVAIGRCMTALNITRLHALDVRGRSIFHEFNPMSWMKRHHPELNYRNIFNSRYSKTYALSTGTASLHYVAPHEMYMYDFLIYDLHLPWRPGSERPIIHWADLDRKSHSASAGETVEALSKLAPVALG